MKRPKNLHSRLLLLVRLLMLTSISKAERTDLSLVSGTVLLKLEVIYLGFFWCGLFPMTWTESTKLIFFRYLTQVQRTFRLKERNCRDGRGLKFYIVLLTPVSSFSALHPFSKSHLLHILLPRLFLIPLTHSFISCKYQEKYCRARVGKPPIETNGNVTWVRFWEPGLPLVTQRKGKKSLRIKNTLCYSL